MKTIIKNKLLTVLLFSSLSACSAVYGGSTSSEGNISILDTPSEISFNGSVNTTSYRQVRFQNRSNTPYQVTNFAFKENGCGAFSLLNITDDSNNILYQPGRTMNVAVNSGSAINFNIRFAPTSCEITEYTTTFVIYYQDAGRLRAENITFNTIVSDNTSQPDETLECEESHLQFYDEFNDPVKRNLLPLESGKPYYLKIKKMSAYIQTTGGFSNFATQVGTAINLDLIPQENQFQPIFIPLTPIDTDSIGTFEIDAITSCSNFILPSPVTDQFFIGATSTLTTADAFTGTIDRRPGYEGNINVSDLVINLKSFINNSNSLLQDPQGRFEINVNVNLTTGRTGSYSYLNELVDLMDDEGEPFLNIQNNQLVGTPLRHGTLTFVGVGEFIDDDAAKLSGEGRQGILENEAYLFIQMEALVTQEI